MGSHRSAAAARSVWHGAASYLSRHRRTVAGAPVFQQWRLESPPGVVSLMLLGGKSASQPLARSGAVAPPYSVLFSAAHELLRGGAAFHSGPERAMPLGVDVGADTEIADAACGPVETVLDRVAIIGSGNWGSVAARLAASNAIRLPTLHDEVRVWVFEERIANGELLTEVINRTKENVKYLPKVKLGLNVVADPDLESAVKNATLLVFVTPHQFVPHICRTLKGKIRSDVKAISLIKGMEVRKEGPLMISNVIEKELGIDCSVLMGANIANEVALEQFSEATVGYRQDKKTADKWVQIFGTPYFQVNAIQDVEGVELCGTLKNVVAIAAGLVDGLNMGNNTKAAIMRIGLLEMILLSKLLFPSVQDATFFESCGIADLITTCFGGRNRKVADAFAKSGGKRSFEDLEAELLQGQKLQGVLTTKEVFEVLKARDWIKSFPLFTTVHAIVTGRLPPSAILEYIEHTSDRIVVTSGRQA